MRRAARDFLSSAEWVVVCYLVIVMNVAACTADRFISNASADYAFEEKRYESRCVAVKGPPDCKAHQTALRVARQKILDAADVAAIGKVPSAQKSDIREALSRVQDFK